MPGTAGATTTRRRAFPYEDLRAENGRRGKHDPEYELLDTGVFDDDRYWIVEVHYAKATPTDLLMSIQVTNAGPDPETLHVLPTAWFRNTWSWDPGAPRPELAATGDTSVRVSHPSLGELELLAGPGPDGPRRRCCSARTRPTPSSCTASPASTPYPKDGINDHVVTGAATVNPARRGTKCAAWYRVDVAPKATVELRLRLRPAGSGPDPATALGQDFDDVVATRRAEADEFYAGLTPAGRLARRGDGDAAGLRRDAVEQAALLLRRGALARRRSRPAGAAGLAARPAATPAGAPSTPST